MTWRRGAFLSPPCQGERPKGVWGPLARLACERGQFVLPTIFIFPSFFLFVFLIYDTAKLSREKIRHQFAVDAAAFVEMTNYSDFLNRSAYVNGAFPMRIFAEGFGDIDIKGDRKRRCGGGGGCFVYLGDVLYQNGVFPYGNSAYPVSPGKPPNPLPDTLNEESSWKIRYALTHTTGKNTETSKGAAKNEDPPDMPGSEYAGVFVVFDQEDAHDWWLNWEDAQQMATLYVQIWQLLGSVEEAQYSVLERLVKQHNFYKKAYWLNTGDPVETGALGAQSFQSSASGFLWPNGVKFFCHKQITYYGSVPTGQLIPPYIEQAPEKPIVVDFLDKCDGGAGLFQILWVKPSELDKMRKPMANPKYAGYPVTQPWTAPGNYFNYDFNKEAKELNYRRPNLHATVSCGERGGAGAPRAEVWPDPTPKFQVRLYP
ncbi:MAG: hypothetical protein HY748_04785 [Elusimicrobia bacterium]|nr:hypothetical protein [Elusimicrobiota bacterium]